MLSITAPAPFPACPAPFNLAAHVLARASDQPDKIALEILARDRVETWRYGAFARAVRAVAAGFEAEGLPEGSRVLLRLGNSVEFPLAFLGAVAAGLLPVATPAALTAREVSQIAATLQPALVIAAQGVSLPEGAWRVMGSDDLRAIAEGCEGNYRMGSPDRAAYLVYTSGTSGNARAVVHAHRAIWARQMMWQDWYGLTRQDRLLHAGAFNWTYTLGTGLLDPLSIGATALVPAAGVDPAELGGLIADHGATVFAAAPGIYRQMLKSGARFELPLLRHGLSAGERLADEVRAAWIAATGKPVHEAFGMSECSTFISSSPTRPAPAGATGYAQTGRKVAVLGTDGQPVHVGTAGVLAVHHSDPGLFLGYFGARSDTRARFQGEWFVTGDQVVMQRDGAITYIGRDDDMMNAGGFRVSPLEVEAALAIAPGVNDLAVTEVELEPGKSIIVCFYLGSASSEALSEFAEAEVARYKCPRAFVRLEALPRTPTGKVNRRALREEWRERL